MNGSSGRSQIRAFARSFTPAHCTAISAALSCLVEASTPQQTGSPATNVIVSTWHARHAPSGSHWLSAAVQMSRKYRLVFAAPFLRASR